MRFMPLSASAKRVRDAARAWSAGEMSRQEYRKIRRRAIADFDPVKPDPMLEDTQRRHGFTPPPQEVIDVSSHRMSRMLIPGVLLGVALLGWLMWL